MSCSSEKKCESHDKYVVAADINSMPELETRQTAERRLLRKLDCRLLPTVVVIAFVVSIDFMAITSARLKGLQSDLALSDVEYDTVLAVLYAVLGTAQLPSNIVINYISRPTYYLGATIFLWGLIGALTGVTHNFTGILTCRIFTGFPQAAFFPGVLYLLSSWYTRKELALRTALLSSGMLVSNSFGNLLSAGILGSMDGVMGIEAWRWLFYIEGAVTMFMGLMAIWLLPDYPYNTRWMTSAERHLAQVRLAEDTGEADRDSEHVSIFEGLKLALKDPKVLIFMLMICSQALGRSFNTFFPTLAATLGYSTTETLLMAAPPWIYAAVASLLIAWHAGVTGGRFFHVTIPCWVLALGYIIALSTMNTAARYFSLFLMTTGFCGVPLEYVWVANVVTRPPAKRSAAIGLVTMFASAGNVVGSYVWRSTWGPEYHRSMVITLCAVTFSNSLALVVRVLLIRENKRMECADLDSMDGPERERIEEAARLEGVTFDEAVRRRMGFRHVY